MITDVSYLEGRRYKAPSYYFPFDQLYGWADCACMYPSAAKLDQNFAMALGRWMVSHCPSWWVSRDMTEALMQTDVPDDLDLSEVEWPHEAFTFFLPEDAFTIGDKSLNVIVASISTDDTTQVLKTRNGTCNLEPPAESERPKLLLLGMNTTADFAYHVGWSWKGPAIQITDPSHMPTSDQAHFPLSEEESHIMGRCAHFLINALLMLNNPQIAAPGERLRSIKTGPKKARLKGELWTPHYLGKTYTIRRLKHTDGSLSTGTKKRFHWRKGHWRKQPHGPRSLGQHKRIWIEPHTIGQPPGGD